MFRCVIWLLALFYLLNFDERFSQILGLQKVLSQNLLVRHSPGNLTAPWKAGAISSFVQGVQIVPGGLQQAGLAPPERTDGIQPGKQHNQEHENHVLCSRKIPCNRNTRHIYNSEDSRANTIFMNKLIRLSAKKSSQSHYVYAQCCVGCRGYTTGPESPPYWKTGDESCNPHKMQQCYYQGSTRCWEL